MNCYWKQVLTILISLNLSSSALANVGLPVIAYGFPFVASLFCFIVLIETVILKLFTSDFSLSIIFKWVTIDNLLTTFIGYPLSALLTALAPHIGLQIGWLIPFPNLGEMYSYHAIALIITWLGRTRPFLF